MLKLESGTVSRHGAGGGTAPSVSVVNVVGKRMATAELIAPFRANAVGDSSSSAASAATTSSRWAIFSSSRAWSAVSACSATSLGTVRSRKTWTT